MRHQPLHFIAGEVVQRPLGHSDDGVLLRPACSKGIDGIRTRQHHHLRRAHLRSNTHFLHDVAQLLLSQRTAGPGLSRPNALCQLAPAFAQLLIGQPPAAQNQQQCHAHIGGHKTTRIVQPQRSKQQPPRQRQPAMHGQQTGQHAQHKQQHQPARGTPRIALPVPE